MIAALKFMDYHMIEIGISDGYDYDETYIEHCYLSGMTIHTIDDIDGDIITASLWIHGNIDVKLLL